MVSLSERQWDLIITSGQVLFFIGAVLFSFYAIDTKQEIGSYKQELRSEGCGAVNESFNVIRPGQRGERGQYLDRNTSSSSSSDILKFSITERGR